MYVTTMCWYAYTSLCILMNCENDHVVSEEGVWALKRYMWR